MRTLLYVLVVSTIMVTVWTDRRNKPRQDRHRTRQRVRDRTSRGLVPQLWANYTTPTPSPANEVVCNDAYLTCAYRGGCGKALQDYMLNCAQLREGLTNTCSKQCQFALIALLSTPEGERLMQCRCESLDKSEEEACTIEKLRVEPCREEVTWNTQPGTAVSCSAATWICAADPQCSTAMLYYQENCAAMFKGRKCSRKCKNSLDIMLRQEAAAKLSSCTCEGTEDFDCAAVRLYTDVLCFGKKIIVEEVETNEVDQRPPQTITSKSTKSTGRTMYVLVSFLASCYVSHLGSAISSFILGLRS